MFGSFILALCTAATALAVCHNNDYDDHFKRAARRHWADVPYVQWQMLKALCCAESSLRPEAISPVGAQGLCQIMPSTWRDLQGHSMYLRKGTPFDPKLAIYASSLYLRMQWDGFYDPRPPNEQAKYSLASYNAGRGNIYKAQKLVNGSTTNWEPTALALSGITGDKNAHETTSYVDRNSRFYNWYLGKSRKSQQIVLAAMPSKEGGLSDQSKEIVTTVASAVAQDLTGVPSPLWQQMLVSHQYMVLPSIMGIFILFFAYKVFDKLTEYKTSAELARGNIAVAVFTVGLMWVVGGIIRDAISAGIGG